MLVVRVAIHSTLVIIIILLRVTVVTSLMAVMRRELLVVRVLMDYILTVYGTTLCIFFGNLITASVSL